METAHTEGLTRASYREAQDRLGIADDAVFAEGVEKILLDEQNYPEFGPWPTGDQGGRAGDPRESADVAAALDYLPVPGMLARAAQAAGPTLAAGARVLGQAAKEGALLPLTMSVGGSAGGAAAKGPTKFLNLSPEDLPQNVGKFTLEQRNGKWVTVSSSGDVFSARGKYTFVVQDGKITVGRSGAALGSRPAAGHVDLALGNPVDYAGEIQFGGTKARGTLRTWNNASGHYQPRPEFATQAGLPMNRFEPWEP
jgi:hypothetical protein